MSTSDDPPPEAVDEAVDERERRDEDPGWLARFRTEIVDGQTLLLTFLALVTALAIGAVLIILSEEATRETLTYFFARPGDFFAAAWETVGGAYGALFRGALGGPRAWSETLVSATPLILTGLAFALPFRALIINIGGEGQFLGGALLGGLVGFGVTGLPMVIHLPLTLLAGFLGGAIVGWVAGILKARTGAHEVITTIMLNNIMILLTDYLLLTALFQRPDRPDPISKAVAGSATLPLLFGAGFRVHWGFVLAVLVAIATWWMLERSTLGFEIKAVGHNPRAARFAGMNPDRIYWLVLAIAGGLAALGGIVQLSGVQGRITPGFAAGLGFDGITVALLGRSSPLGVIAAALLFGGLRAGGLAMQADTQISLDLVTVLQALIVIFIAAPALIRSLWHVKTRKESGLEATASGGWSA
ncbi:ABC transporter permease [Salsipaludibacter albus]|uniref:ABC transporter permease n=1 Tax=Salsipaludibacter albus TaxID=2849650 RepID=UPI001EE44DC4|nr:ABC transporter permease [Salsipaludibacter albus]MBY5161627.1 ABC transporter permease [Salsipaludibacter albus]